MEKRIVPSLKLPHSQMLLPQGSHYHHYATTWFLRCLRESVLGSCVSQDGRLGWRSTLIHSDVQNPCCTHQEANHTMFGALWSSSDGTDIVSLQGSS